MKTLCKPGWLSGMKLAKGTEDAKSIRKLPLRYEIAIFFVSVSSRPKEVSRYVVLNVIITSIRKVRSTSASSKAIFYPLIALSPFSS